MDTAAYGKVAAELRAEENGIKGYLASNSRDGRDRLRQELPRVEELLGELTGENAANEVRVLLSQQLDLVNFELTGGDSVKPEGKAQRDVQTKELYGIAEKLICFFREGLTKEA